MAASEWLAARGFGKVPDQVIIEATKVDATSEQTSHSDRQWEGRFRSARRPPNVPSMAALSGFLGGFRWRFPFLQNWLSRRSVACALGAV